MPSESGFRSQRQTLQKLLGRIHDSPFEYLPERSVESLYQFFAGYGMLGGPISDELAHFSMWLMAQYDFPAAVGHAGRFIRLNSNDSYDSYQNFFKNYHEFAQTTAEGPPLADPKYRIRPEEFDFYRFLFGIRHRPGMYIGEDNFNLLAALLLGYFRGKADARLELTIDEQQFLAFEPWLVLHHQLEKEYPWYRLFLLWPGRARMGTVESFFGAYDDYLTDYGKKPGSLDDLFEVVKLNTGSKIQRRKVG